QGAGDFRRRCRDPARRYRASVPLREQRLLRGRRLSAGTADGSGAAVAGGARKGAQDDPDGRIAEDRSGDGEGWAADPVVEAVVTLRRRNSPIHILTAKISSRMAEKPNATRPNSSPDIHRKPMTLPVNLRSPGPKATQSKVSA